jgi:DHA1 family inner membrane transport protein
MIGRLVDRISRRAAIASGLAGCSAGGFVAAASTSLVWFTVGLAMIASFGMVLVVGAGAWIVDHVPFERRGRIVGLVETAWALGLLVGVSTLGLVTALSSWRWAYAVGASVAAGVAVMTWRRIGSETTNPRAPEPVETPVAAVITRMSRAGWYAVLGVVGLVCASEALFVTFGAWLKDDFDVNDGVLAAATFALGAMELGASSLSSLRTDRWGKERSVIGGALVMAVAAVGLLTMQDWALPGMVAVAIFIGCFEFSIVSAIPIAGDLVPGNPARGLALLMASSAIGRGITTIPTTWLYDHHGIGASAALAAGWTFVAAAMMVARLRATRP